ncbi:phytanoyl-CoA dioxygenase family protein [Hymenobacter bucti]|uniref:Phytanoyl-CoA dioxygenase family protein n=1 Tax=Hymenobacter bucti TaxID=1844114 RepID=A0ABW4R1G9_9BACT
MTTPALSPEQIQQYHQDGYLIVRNFLSPAEIDKLHGVALEDSAMSKHAINVNDSTGKRSKLSLWYKPGDDVYGLLTRRQSLVDAVDALLDGDAPVCHFHSKLMQKEPRVGGAWEWHQDYGYWYKNEFLLPEQMMSVMVAITEANRANGCLQVVPGSHKMGRVEHGFAGEQVGASQRYVDLALQTMPLVYVELQAGDVLFFHSNILHRSEANLSDQPRWSMISCYNRASNIGYNDSASSNSSITPLETVPDDALLRREAHGMAEDGADFLRKEADVALK